jgi:hypothetical protein
VTSPFAFTLAWLVVLWVISNAPTEGRMAVIYLVAAIAAVLIDAMRVIARRSRR